MNVGAKMALKWLVVLSITSSFVIGAPSDTIVVTSDNDEDFSLKTVFGKDIDDPLLPIKLTQMDVTSEVSMRYAYTTIATQVRNPAKRSQEALFRVLLPDTAFISGFQMTINGKTYKAYVKEKEEAKQIYNDAVSHGIGAAHVAAKARDSNEFKVTVNVEANSSAVFNLTYEELLVRRNGAYNLDINLHPGGLVPKLIVTVHIKETQKITILRVPELRTGNEIDATEDDIQNSLAVINRSKDDHEATITFKPNISEQQRLMDVYTEKSKEGKHSDRKRPPYRGLSDDTEVEGVLGQFTVQYDVDRPKEGEILVNEGYFVHTYAPSSLPSLKKNVVFVLDTSGSMSGRKIEQLREAMKVILSEISEGDYISIVEFNSGVKVHDLLVNKEPSTTTLRSWYNYDEPTPKMVKYPPSQATTENVKNAKAIVENLKARGGTNIAGALDVAIELVQRGVGWRSGANNTATNVTLDFQEGDQLEPIIIFLTDGEATVGETDSKRIINRVSEKNYGESKAPIFTLAFGDDADHKLLRTMSLRNDGFMRHIYEAADAALQIRDFFRQLSSPLLSHVKFVYPPDQIKEDTLTKTNFRTIYAGSETIVAGKVADHYSELTPEVTAYRSVDRGLGRMRIVILPKVPVIPQKIKEGYWPLERLWAYLSIKQLLDERDAKEDNDASKEKIKAVEKKALDLAMKYEFVTELTSLVVVKPNATSAVNAESVDKKDNLEHDKPSSYLHMAKLPLLGPGSGSGAKRGRPHIQSGFHAPLASYDHAENWSYRRKITKGFVGPRTTRIFPTTSAPNRLALYSMESFKWTATLLHTDTDELVLPVNGTDVHLKLSRDQNVPKASGGDEECGQATDGSPGVCVYLSRCDAARDITVALYTTTYCTVNNYAGVCCPKNSVKQEVGEP